MLNASQNTKFSPWNTVQKRPGLPNSFLYDLKDEKRLAVSEPWLFNDGLKELNTKQMTSHNRIMKWTAYGFEAGLSKSFYAVVLSRLCILPPLYNILHITRLSFA